MARNLFILSKHASLSHFMPKSRKGQKANLQRDEYFSGVRLRHFSFSKSLNPDDVNVNGHKPGYSEFENHGFEKRKIFLDIDEYGVVVNVDESTLNILIPIGSSRQLFYRKDNDWIMVSDDPRMLVFEPLTRDPVGIVAALSFRAPLGSLTPWKEIRRLAPGIHWQINYKDFDIIPLPIDLSGGKEIDSRVLSTDREREDALLAVIDSVLERKLRHGPGMLLFSGGVDSGLLAARAAAMGYKDLVLMHSSRGKDDAETIVAKKMAKHLGMPFQAFEYSPEKAVSYLEEIFDAYTLFADFSVLPTWQLAVDAASAMPEARFAMDGIGADSLFADDKRTGQWRALYQIPKFFRRTAGQVNDILGLWHRPSRHENLFRAIRRSAVWPSEIQPYTIHSLAQVGYKVDHDFLVHFSKDFRDWYCLICKSAKNSISTIPLGLSIISSKGVQKHYTAMDQHDKHISSPFLEPELAEFGVTQISNWPAEEVISKSILKRIMSRSMQEELIYRPKSGLSVDPIELFNQPHVLGAMQQVLEDRSGPLHDAINLKNNQILYKKILNKNRLPWYTYEYVWQMIFVHHWMVNNEALLRC